MFKKNFIIIFCWTLLVPVKIANAALAITKQKIDNIVTEFMQNNHVPGLALAVLQDGKPFLIKGYGYAHIETNDPVNTETLFGIGSVSKVITAFALMTLVQEGKINLDNSILAYVRKAPQQWRNVTVRELLSHSSGIPQHQGPHLPWMKVWNELAQKPMQFQPGTAITYNNFGYALLGRIIENVSHQPLINYLSLTVFNPLGMEQTGIPDSLLPPNLAAGYKFHQGKIVPNQNQKPWKQMGGSGGIVSNISDMAKWDNALSAGKILTSAAYRQMWTPVLLKNGKPAGHKNWAWALGWQITSVNDKRIAFKNGGIRGYSSWIERHLDDKVSIIILTNTNHVPLERLAKRIFNQVMDAPIKKDGVPSKQSVSI
ncbi:beta-lactamase family protein [Fluoribacter dumoffii]|uniref:serine hydrolase domain-containing protein n=1 Tax=Fluoribacter dumoffii TaxID=463 RepID=UPI002242ED38|nr:serine hydrolase domain-containing protein [Fluoribacter dumoffii]MCW8419235.1 beta-lactamase family protein [Fluoribacter dumoffii]MCW8452890.1 beta-lactamase family protein [Fluoribacter dumoffii]MCW8459860.1 beta-lactamase family protein [Fluoribacter dumoffii]MCW8483337.1 beta-lactamase family protein [Fluoribacter dumoffii]